ncbi:MAG TPA: cytochrome c peroxidase [Anaerolineales bacterium]|nr:cytochrome c peroxidase [Anaerolineales bacterium]
MTKPFRLYLYLWIFLTVCLLGLSIAVTPNRAASAQASSLDSELQAVLREAGFTGRIESTLEQRLGRRLDLQLADLGRMLWFDTLTGLNDDNACAGCHSPTAGFGDTQSIAIGIESNQIVGPHRAGPRNMRRAPMVINSAFFPRLMWNSRFAALSGDPFDNRAGFQFPLPEGLVLSGQPHLLAAQAFIPPTERNEAAGFHFAGDSDAIRAEVASRLNASSAYRKLFAKSFSAVKAGAPITYEMFAQAIAEFEFTLTFANAPVDRFARGELGALTEAEKQGALLFFGAARCSVCHSVGGESNEMFSDFREHVLGVPQIAATLTNSLFDGPGLNEDFGLEQVSGDPADRYKFRTSPLRNVAVQPTFMHNGAFTRLEDAIRHHLNVVDSVLQYTPASQNLPSDLSGPLGPMDPVLARLDPAVSTPIVLTETQFEQLLAFVRNGLLDPRATPERLRRFVPHTVPSGRPVMTFEFP